MKLTLRNIALIFLLSGFTAPASGEPDPEAILEAVKSRFRTIVDFTAEVVIEINVDFINIPDKSARLIYKYPNKLKFKSGSFLMIPRKGIGFSVFELLESDYSAIYAGTEDRDGRQLDRIKVIPLSDKPDIVLATLFIDAGDSLVRYMEATTRKSGFFTTEFAYGEDAPLPESNTIRFEVEKIRLPLKFMGGTTVDKSKMKEGAVGEIILRYGGYEINRGLEDKLFEEDSVRVD